MNQRLRESIEELFADAPAIKQVSDLREEIMNNAVEKFADLTAEGMAEDEAIRTIMAGIGDVDELIKYIKQNAEMDPLSQIKQRKISAKLITVAVALYFVAFIALIILSEYWHGIYALAITALIAAVPTCILVYNYVSNPHYSKTNDTMVENFKEWQSSKETRKKMRGALSSTLWIIITILYFVISFTTMQWHITWLIFLIGAAIESLITLLLSMKG
ncbi:MAG TPA: hypothetical protein DEQ02_01065 [Ruminococcaceae bacterium]|nr:hypothetical protein [Oscillospiraceae bacterium]